YLRQFMDEGFGSASKKLGLPIHFIARRINTHYYQAIVPVTTDHAALEEIEKNVEQNLGAAMGRFAVEWREEQLPEIMRYIAEWQAFDLPGATMPQLIEHLDTSLARTKRLMEIHFI